MKYVELKLWKCQNSTVPGSTVCKDKAYIDNFFDNEQFSFAFVNSIFQIDNYTSPISYFIDDQLFFQIDAKVSKRANFYVQKSEANLEDDIVQLGQSDNKTFFTI